MMQAADSRMADDLGVATRLRGGRSHRRRALAQPEVRSVVVVIRDKLGEESLQVPLVEDDYVVEQISPHGRDPAFRRTVLPRAVRRDLLAPEPMCSITARTSVPYFLSLASRSQRLGTTTANFALASPLASSGGGSSTTSKRYPRARAELREGRPASARSALDPTTRTRGAPSGASPRPTRHRPTAAARRRVPSDRGRSRPCTPPSMLASWMRRLKMWAIVCPDFTVAPKS